MIKDKNGKKVSPRQKAAEILLTRQSQFLGPQGEQTNGMTEREILLVKAQMERLHNKIMTALNNALIKGPDKTGNKSEDAEQVEN